MERLMYNYEIRDALRGGRETTMKNAYYVYSIDKEDYNEWQEGKYDTLDEARKAANDREYSRKQGKDKGSTEIRQYVNDIEDEDCTDFDYNTFPYADMDI